jgi:hypothetical protein
MQQAPVWKRGVVMIIFPERFGHDLVDFWPKEGTVHERRETHNDIMSSINV